MLRFTRNSLPEITVLELYLPSSDGHLCSRKKMAQFPPNGRRETALHHLTWSHFQNWHVTHQLYKNTGNTLKFSQTRCDQFLWKWTRYQLLGMLSFWSFEDDRTLVILARIQEWISHWRLEDPAWPKESMGVQVLPKGGSGGSRYKGKAFTGLQSLLGMTPLPLLVIRPLFYLLLCIMCNR